MDYKEKIEYWTKKDSESKKLDKEELAKKIDEFLKSHNTLALATGFDSYVRCTPVEYNYLDGYFYIFSEGGKKFIGLEKNKNVSFAIFESYKGFGNIHSLQGMGKVEILEPDNKEYEKLCEYKHIPLEQLKKMDRVMPIIKIIPSEYDYLDSNLKKEGYSNRQHFSISQK